MFENFRDKIQNVQNDINKSLKTLAISPEGKDAMRSTFRVIPKRDHINQCHVSLNAGAELLQRYQCQWRELHLKNEENARNAETIAKVIDNIDRDVKKHHNAMSDILTQFVTLPQIIESIESIERDVKRIKVQFEKMENLLTEFENQKEDFEFDKFIMDHHYQISMYKDQRTSEFETIKVKMALNHTEKVREYEKRQQIILKERHEAFEAAFEEEFNNYKTHGKIERKNLNVKDEPKPKIEEIIVETDDAEAEAFAKFLEDEH